MMRALSAFAIMGAVWTILPSGSEAATITIIRGNQVEKVSTARKSQLPHILRGIPTAMSPTDAPVREHISGLQVLQARGNSLWLRDSDSGEIIACTIWSSGMVGRDKLRCTGNRF